MQTQAVILKAPGEVGIGTVGLPDPGPGDLFLQIHHSGVSTGTEKLLWNGRMPSFPGMGYPLIPGYEAVGEVIEAGANTNFRAGDYVFVPGSTRYEGAKGLFGAAAAQLITRADRVTRIERALGPDGAMLALAATAHHAIAGGSAPDLIVGHGVLGRLLARLTCVAGAPPPNVWEIDPTRQTGAEGYEVLHPNDDDRRDYANVYDASGDAGLLNDLIGRICKGGEVVLAGFYSEPLQFAFPPAFMKEARLRIAAEWTPDDMEATRLLVESGALRLDDLITHNWPAGTASQAYDVAFRDPSCLKMILDWSTT